MARRDETAMVDGTVTSRTPAWPTRTRGRLPGGRLLGVDGSMWLYRTVPMSPVSDSRGPDDIAAAAAPMMSAFSELATLARPVANRRKASRSTYRRFHLLSVRLPLQWQPPGDGPLPNYLRTEFGSSVHTYRRLTLFGVRLVPRVGGGHGWRASVDSFLDSVSSGGVPVSDFDEDTAAVEALLARAGMGMPGPTDLAAADSWWNGGHAPDVPCLVFPEALAFFRAPGDARAAKRAYEAGAPADRLGGSIVSMATVQDLDLPMLSADDPASWWVSQMLYGDALVVSVRGMIEPASLTRGELRRNRRRNEEDVRDRAAAGRMEMAEQGEHLAELSMLENFYATGGPPTLVDTSAVVGFDGLVDDMDALSSRLTAKLNPMLHRQAQGWAETLLCSAEQASPHLHDLPAQSLAYAGANDLAVVGDAPGPRSLLVGMSQRDRQPAWLDPMATHDEDSLPITLVAGSTGSGKTVLMTWIADQYARTGHPVIIVDLKQTSDLTAAVSANPSGQVASLDDLASGDGVFDPVRFSLTPASGAELAASMLIEVNPWGAPDASLYEVGLIGAITYGISLGATCSGEALQIAVRDGRIAAELVKPVVDLAAFSPMFRSCVGFTPGTSALRDWTGLTLVKAGSTDVVAAASQGRGSVTGRAAAALTRMAAFGSAAALTGRDGLLLLDEAWIFLQSGRGEIERLGRLARSQRVSPMLFTQRVSDALKADLTGYIARGLILPIQDRAEAAAACRLFKLDKTEDRLRAITAAATLGEAGGGTAPNWGSMRALRDRETGEVLRGTIAIYCDPAKRAIPVEVRLPEAFLRRASTNRRDIDARAKASA
jgi:hypothetical protein